MTAPENIISDEEITRVHGYANFGDMTPREVVNDGVRKYAVGFTGGHTQLCILMEHGLIAKPKPGKYQANLTQKGKRYARSIWRTHFNAAPPLSAALKLPEVAALVEALRESRRAIGDHFAPHDCYATGPVTGDHYKDLVQCPACSFIAMHDAALSALDAAKGGE